MNEERNERSCKRKFSNNESVSVDKNSLKAVSYAVAVTTRLNEKPFTKCNTYRRNWCISRIIIYWYLWITVLRCCY